MIAWWCAAIARRERSRPSATSPASLSASSPSTAPAITCSVGGCLPPRLDHAGAGGGYRLRSEERPVDICRVGKAKRAHHSCGVCDGGHARTSCTRATNRATAATSAAVGIDGAAPIRCTQIDAAALAYSSASRIGFATGKLRGERADEAIAGAGGVHRLHRAPGNQRGLAADDSASTPRLPSVTQMVWSAPIGSDRAASMKRAGVVGIGEARCRRETRARSR